MEGFAEPGAELAAMPVPPVRTRYTLTRAAMFFSGGSPRSSTSSGILPDASSFTRDEITMPPFSASGSSRAATMTPSPNRSSPSATTSP